MAAVRSFDDRDRSPVSGTVRSRGAISPAVPQRNRPWSFPSQYGSSSVMDDMLRSDTLRRRARRTTEGNVVEDLIDFFRNTPPPPGNFVSTPDPLDEELKENKRFAFWPFRRKANVAGKEARTAPRRIRLPDSAVAGTTLDGYRHIAISIPIEYAHLELLTDRAAVPGAEHAKAGQVEDENSSRSNNSDEDTASYHTPALSPSSPGLPPEEAADVWGQSENWPALSDFLAPYGRGTFQTSSGAHGASFSHPVMYRDHQPHTLSDIPSETQTLQSIHLAPSPVTVVADIEPSSQTPSQHIGADTTDEASSTDTSSQPRTPVLAERRRPRRVRGISDLRVLAPSPDPSPCSSRTSYPSPVSHPTGDRIRRYDGRQRARQREFDLLLLDRLERLEQALERWTSALAPLLGHPSRGVAESARESEVMSDGREDERSSVSSGGGFDLSRARGLPVGGIGGRGDATGDDAIERTGEEEEEEYEEEDEEDDEEENINDTSWLCNMSNSSKERAESGGR
ncbi:1211a2a9-117e-4e65-b0b9-3a6e60be0e33 [Thermothielavioides terrestris]|uniref:1211a2a9-117e-4e65-b0b9-3a6e60be0e33 n=1 Tax=Thermothielavioides terrestris TaxID=2587410 RepID=A0A3S4EYS3_9PEZI|nr:1211a2a9-117e-4e65-b0b9-3a6e60be0e33 [Thermothielavioides terrestris]